MTPFLTHLTIFGLAVFVGFSVVWRVTPALHSPLMAVTNAVSSVIVVGALLGVSALDALSEAFGLTALLLCTVNIVGGFWITHRMLGLFTQNRRKG